MYPCSLIDPCTAEKKLLKFLSTGAILSGYPTYKYMYVVHGHL